MEPQLTPQHEAQARAFIERHRIGLLTILFTDIVGSVDLKKHLGDYIAVQNIQRHHAAVREVLRGFKDGEEIETAGDSFLIVFAKPSDAVKFSLLLQARLRELTDTTGCAIRDRIGIHLGEVFIDEGGGETRKNLFGMQVDTAARVMSLAGAGQTVMTRAVFDNARQVLKGQDLPGIGELLWMSHGPYLLKGVDGPLEICEAGEVGSAPLNAPGDSEKARRHAGADGEPVLGWRPALGQGIPRTQWELTEKLGEGGFGEVWLARHKTFNEARVFKFCFRADRVRSLKREVTLFKVLKERVGEHPRIVRLMDIYFEEPPYYLEMEYVPGRDLATWAAEQGGLDNVPLATRLEIVAQVADALQAAHDCGIIHRDIKPSNILISSSAERRSPTRREFDAAVPDAGPETGAPADHSLAPSGGERAGVRGSSVSQPSTPISQLSVKLTDFGIGQIVSDEALGELTKAGFTQTLLGSTTGSASGTRLYMAPELLSGGKATPRSDIYSLGVVLYQLATGDLTRPLTIDWARHIPDPLLREDLEQCFAGDPQERFAAVSLLAKRLRSVPERRTALETEAQAQRARERAAYRLGIIRTATLATMAIALFAGLAWYGFEQAGRARQSAKFEALEKAKAESAQAKTSEALQHIKITTANREIAEGNTSTALAILASVLRDNSSNWVAANRALNLVLDGAAIPLALGVADSQALIGAEELSSDYSRDTVSDGSTVRFRHVRTGQFSERLKFGDSIKLGERVSASSALFSPDGRRLVTFINVESDRIGPDEKRKAFGRFRLNPRTIVQVWDSQTGHPLSEAVEQRGSAGFAARLIAAFTEDGQQVVAVSGRSARVWERRNGQVWTDPVNLGSEATTASFSPDGRLIVAACIDGTAMVWDVLTGQILNKTAVHSSTVKQAQFSPDGQCVVTGSWDKTARVWDARTGQPLGKPMAHTHGLLSARFSPDGQLVVTTSDGGVVRVWDSRTGEPITEPLKNASPVKQAHFTIDGQGVVARSADNTARVWEVRTGRPIAEPMKPPSRVDQARFTPDGQRVVTRSTVNMGQGYWVWQVWDARTCQILHEAMRPGHSNVVSAELSPDNRLIATGSRDGIAQVLDGRTGQVLTGPMKHAKQVTKVGFSPESQRILTVTEDKSVRVWDANTGKPISDAMKLDGSDEGGVSAYFSHDGQRVITLAKTPRVWDARTGQPLSEPLKLDESVTSLDLSPDCRHIATSSQSNGLQIWDVRTGRPITEILVDRAGALKVLFSPQGQRIVTISPDTTVRVWDARTGQPLSEPMKHSDPLSYPVFSPDGSRIITKSSDNSVRVWDAQTGQPLSERMNHTESVQIAEFSPDGQRIIIKSSDNSVRIWDVPVISTPAPPWLASLMEAVAGERLNARGLAESLPHQKMQDLRGELLKTPDSEPLSAWVKWFLADRGTRTISPFSSVTVPEYVRRRIEENTLESLREATRLNMTNGLAYARLAKAVLSEDSAKNPRCVGEADFFSRYALKWSPDDPEVKKIREEIAEAVKKLTAP